MIGCGMFFRATILALLFDTSLEISEFGAESRRWYSGLSDRKRELCCAEHLSSLLPGAIQISSCSDT